VHDNPARRTGKRKPLASRREGIWHFVSWDNFGIERSYCAAFVHGRTRTPRTVSFDLEAYEANSCSRVTSIGFAPPYEFLASDIASNDGASHESVCWVAHVI